MLFVLVSNVAIYLLALNFPLSFFFFLGFNSSYCYPLRTASFILLFASALVLTLPLFCKTQIELSLPL